MQRLFTTKGRLFWLETPNGEPVSGRLAKPRPVLVDVKYELKPSPHQPLVVDIYGRGLWGVGQKEQLALDNGVALTGRTRGGVLGGDTGQIMRVRMIDVEASKIELHPTEGGSPSPDLDAAVLGIVSSEPLGHGSCANGVARPGYPFSFRKSFPKEPKTTPWSSLALRLQHDGLEITLVGTSNYWTKFVDLATLQHDSIVGVRKSDRGSLQWEELNDIADLLSNFLGWINHCSAPAFHIKGYRKGKLVYRGYDLYPHPTVQRDGFSWLPMFGIKDENGAMRVQTDLVQSLLEEFAKVWAKNKAEGGVFHIALDMLRSRSKGSPRSEPAVGYLRDTFGACSILISMLIGPGGRRPRRDIMLRCLQEIGVPDRLPLAHREDWDYVVQNHPELWWAKKSRKILDDEKGTLSRPLANVENWLLHIDDPTNAKMLLSLPTSVQQYLVEVSAWLADLMAMRVVGYHGCYFNRLTRTTEIVPWAE